MGASQNYNVSLNINANAQSAEKQLQNLQRQLQSIASMKVNVGVGNMSQDLEKASQAAMKLSSYLTQATNIQTGNLDFSKFYQSIQKSGMSLQQYGDSLQRLGPAGQKAFVSLASSIAKSEIPLTRTSKLVDGMWSGLKRTAGWQIQSSMIHGIIGGVQRAVGYAKDLNKSLTDIRIVTGSSADEMARFAQKANAAAKRLSTTTTDYTKASLIYYQQGLSDAEVKARTEATIKMANATGTSAQMVSDQMTAIWNNYDNGSKSLTHYADVMTALGAATASSTDEIAQGLQKFASISNTVGLSYEYAASALATITAESRESADVVGNALKTLFSRIQGLKLGETLDDGTTLNKYSMALSKVGISIKDQAGGLKDMDDILNEMGTKWNTLARDEKMALAQTVAGVRQYTQLMTLMENWDDFKRNLNVANTSAGTLDAQAQIQAESWEAASKRVRAAWEGLWDNLISSDGFITVLDGLAGVVGFLDKMVTGLGGAGGALLTFGGIMTSVFNKQISSSISNMAYGIKMMMPGQYQKMVDERSMMIEAAKGAIGKDTIASLGKENEYAMRRHDLDASLSASLRYSRNKDHMTAEQQMFEEQFARRMDEIQTERIQAASQLDRSLANRYDFFGQYYNQNMSRNSLGDAFDYQAMIDSRKAIIQESIKAKEAQLYTAKSLKSGKPIEKSNLSSIVKKRLKEEIATLQNINIEKEVAAMQQAVFNRTANTLADNTIANQIAMHQQTIQDLEAKYANNKNVDVKADDGKEGTELAKDQKAYKAAQQSLGLLQKTANFGQPIQQATTFSQALQAQGKAVAGLNQMFSEMPETANAERLLVGLSEFSSTAANSMQGNSFIKGLTHLAERRISGEISDEEFQTQYNKFKTEMLPTFTGQAMDKISGAIYDTLQANPEFDGHNMTREEFMEQAKEYQKTEEGRLKLQQIDELYKKTAEERQKNVEKQEKIKTGTDAVVSGARGAMQALAAGESLKGLVNSFSDGTATLTSTLTGLTSVALQSSMGFQGLQTALAAIPKLGAGAAGIIAGIATAVLAAISLIADWVDKKTTSMEEFQQNIINSNNELTQSSQSTADAATQAANANENYYNLLDRAKSLNQSATDRAQNIYEANKAALDLIQDYDLTSEDYSTGADGLITIDKAALERVERDRTQSAKQAEYADILGQAMNHMAKSEAELAESRRDTSKIISEQNDITEAINTSFNDPGAVSSGASTRMVNNQIAAPTEAMILKVWKEYQETNNRQIWDAFTAQYGQVNWKKVEEALTTTTNLENERVGVESALSSAHMLVANKLLADNGVDTTKKGGQGYAHIVAEEVGKITANAFLDLESNAALTTEQQKIVTELLEEYAGIQGAGQFKSENGYIMYKGEGDTEYSHVTRQTLNAWKAQEDIEAQTPDILARADREYENLKELYGKGAEAALSIQEFGTLAGASIASITALQADTEAWNAVWAGRSANERTAAEESWNGVSNFLGADGLGLTQEQLEHVNMGSVESLMGSIPEGELTDFTNLFNAVQKAVNPDGDPEMTGKILDILAGMDFSGNDYENALYLRNALSELGDVDVGNLPDFIAYMKEIAGIGPGEDHDDSRATQVSRIAALNQITPYGAVSEDVANASGLSSDLFTTDENGNKVFIGTQSDIDVAKNNIYSAFGANEDEIDAQQDKFRNSDTGIANHFAQGTEFDDVNAFKQAATGVTGKGLSVDAQAQIDKLNDTTGANVAYNPETGEWSYELTDENGNKTSYTTTDSSFLSRWYTKDGGIGGTGLDYSGFVAAATSTTPTPTASSQALLDYFGWEMGADGQVYHANGGPLVTDAEWDQARKDFNAGASTDESQGTNTGTLFAQLTHANDIMYGVEQGITGFVEDGVISDEAWNRLKSLPPTSERAAGAFKDLEQARQDYDPKNEQSVKNYEAAESNYALQTSIDAVAAARGIDADMLAEQVALMEQQGMFQDEDSQMKALQAAEILEYQSAIDALSSSYSDLSKTLRTATKGSNEWLQAMAKMKKLLADVLGISADDLSNEFMAAAEASGLLAKAARGDAVAIGELRKMEALTAAATRDFGMSQTEVNKIIAEQGFAGLEAMFANGNLGAAAESFVADWNTIINGIKTMSWDQILNDQGMQTAIQNVLTQAGVLAEGVGTSLDALTANAMNAGFKPVLTEITANENGQYEFPEGSVIWESTDAEHGAGVLHTDIGALSQNVNSASTYYAVKFVPINGSGSGNGGGGGGGGGPKKVANKRKSQTVKRYKKNDSKRASAQSAKKSASTQKDYLYGESKIAQMEKINKLAEKEARITSDRIKESRKYLEEDRENLIRVMQKWGYEATFDEDGFLTSYEEAWTKVHEKIAKLYEDNELSEDEQKLEEDYKVELEELNGALEDYENSLKELQSDIESYEESLYEMYDNKVEQLQHKVEFKIELNEDDLSYFDFWIEALGDSLYNALSVITTMGQKTGVLFDGIDTYKQGIQDIYDLSDDPFHTWATGGLEGVLSQDQVDALRENRDGLMDYMTQLLELRDSIQDQVLDTFDKWQEKLETIMSNIEHYGSVLEHFKNIIDIVGKDALGLNNQFINSFEQSAVNQSMTSIDAAKSQYDALVQTNAEAQQNLNDAITSGDKERIEHWEEVVKNTNQAMQEAQDSLLTSLENTLTMIADQFESAMTRAVETFNDAIYNHGGLSGLQSDYDLMREQADLIAEDYDKIYQLSKINRNINKTLSDSSIIAGKEKMKSLQKEINELQASGVELSKYDLEYLQAKYELRLAEIELENAKNNKDTVRLSKDNEGNWSYVYTSSVDKVDEAQQKYEDALYNMQNLSYEYMEEMSSKMMSTSLAMMEEIQALRIQDFDSYDAYAAEIQRIQDKYSEFLSAQESELNKSIDNNEELYNRDWLAYSQATGYKISADKDWADNYSESTLGALLGSDSSLSTFADTVYGLSTTLTQDLGAAALVYFANVETAMQKYGTSIAGFGATVSSTVSTISSQSSTAASDMKTMAADMVKSFQDISNEVVKWQEEFSAKITTMLEEIGNLITKINNAVEASAKMTGNKSGAGDLIGTKDAIKLLNKTGELGTFEEGKNGTIKVNGQEYANWLAYNSEFINAIDDAVAHYSQAELDSDDRTKWGERLKELFKRYNLFKEIVSRIYDPTSLSTLDLGQTNYSSFDTGGYTGEWGDSGKFAMLHEKELILNANDTENFLEALNISRDMVNSIIEMNAKQSSLGFGNLTPASFRDGAQHLEQQVSIVAEFPNATNHNEIEEAFSNLINQASQYAHRYKI